MKQYEFDLTEPEIKKFFIAIRDKKKIIEILMIAIKHMLVNPKIQPKDVKGKLILRIDDMKRLLFYSENKFFSISFPFSVEREEDKSYTFYSNEIKDIDNIITSKVIGLINSEEFEYSSGLDFLEPINNFDEMCNDLFWVFFKNLLLFETGYIRYDIDAENFEKYLARGEGDIHPKHHYDVFYSNNTTFKIGLDDKISNDDFIDLLDVKTDCKYLRLPIKKIKNIKKKRKKRKK